MDAFAAALLFLTAVFCGSLLVAGLVALSKVRHGRRERLQMKRHLQKIGMPATGDRSARWGLQADLYS